MAKKRTTGTRTSPTTRRPPAVEVEGVTQSPQEPEEVEVDDSDDGMVSRAELLEILKSIDNKVADAPQPAPKKQGLLVQYWWVAVLILVGAFFWYENRKTTPDVNPGPGPSPVEPVDADLLTLATRSFRTRDAAEAFANASEQLAVMVEEDGKSKTPSFTKRSHIGERLIPQLCRATILAKIDVNREDFVEFVVSAWKDETQWPQAEGVLTAEDRQKAVKQFKALSRAASEVR